MDSSPANIAPKGTTQGDYFTTTLGPYDYWGHRVRLQADRRGPDGEKDELDKIARKVARPDLVYGTDEDLFGSADPFINLWDLGRDPLQFGKDRIKLAESLLPKLADSAIDDGESYARLRLAFTMLLYQYGDASYLAARYVGGTAVNRDHKGDPDGRDPLAPVAGDRQREALAFPEGRHPDRTNRSSSRQTCCGSSARRSGTTGAATISCGGPPASSR